MKHKLLVILLIFAFVISACGTAAAPEAMEDHGDTMVEENAPAIEEPAANTSTMEEPAAPAEEVAMQGPEWFGISLTNVHTGQAFTINDLKGKVVLVETMAVWCSNCKRQQGQVKVLHEMLANRDDFISLGLDIDPNENADILKTYVENNGFHWYYAVSTADTSRDIAALYGNQFLNPPSTPMLIIDRKGVAHPLPFGIKSAEELLSALQPYLDEAI